MNKKMSILMFSGEYDKALAALILSNTARGMDIDVTMFFAFWGLMLIRDSDKTSEEEKTTSEKMFASMTPNNIEDLPLSKMNFGGMGKKMLTGMMEDNGTPSLKEFLDEALEKGVNIRACKLSCEVMGFGKEDLLDQASIITAEDYLNDALASDIQLFI